MAGLLLETKLRMPRRRRSVVARPRLSDRLNQAPDAAVTLVSAPAGFGKTTLLTEWLAKDLRGEAAVAWLSLDERDNDATSFWTYLVAAVDAAVPGVGSAALSLLQSPQSSTEAVLTALLNDVDAAARDIVLVLDDFHAIDARDVLDGVAFLLDHLPAQLRLVIASRMDPPLPLALLRARGELSEIRAADLRFTADESTTFLTDVMGLQIAADYAAALDERTEGWVAALQLAALSLQGREDVAGFIAGFTGDDRYVVDYLVEEVLQRQDEDVRRFLLQTCILERLSGPLCDAVTGAGRGRELLESFDRGNLFVVALDDHRGWYRYHHLFRDVLRTHLMHDHADDVADLHRRASTWFEQDGQPSEAIHHALGAQDFERAAALIELSIPEARRTRQVSSLLEWCEALPRDVIAVRPVLSVGFVGALMSTGQLEAAGELLDGVEGWLDQAGESVDDVHDRSAAMVVVDEQEHARLPGTVQMYRAAQAQARGDVTEALRRAVLALELAPDDDHAGRAAAAGFLGIAWWSRGDLVAAHEAWRECMTGLQRAGWATDVLGCAVAMGDIRLVEGRLDEALRSFEDALRLVAVEGRPPVQGSAAVHAGISEVHRERNDLDAARSALLRGQELREPVGLPHQYRWHIAMAGLLQAEGDLDGALGLLDDAAQVYVNDFFPQVRPIPALRARLQIAQGELDGPADWARRGGLSVADDLSYVCEFDHITLARLFLAQARIEGSRRCLDDAIGLLERLLSAAEAGGRTGSVIEILALQALADDLRSDLPGAFARLDRAMTLAAPQRYARTFIDEGPPMATLLAKAVRRVPDGSYAGRVLAAFRPPQRTRARQGLIDPLSERELDVLRLLRSDLTGPEIARELVVSLNTIRTHTKSIYAKLGSNHRRAAVRRAEELNLL